MSQTPIPYTLSLAPFVYLMNDQLQSFLLVEVNLIVSSLTHMILFVCQSCECLIQSPVSFQPGQIGQVDSVPRS